MPDTSPFVHLPTEVIERIMCYVSHPCADLTAISASFMSTLSGMRYMIRTTTTFDPTKHAHGFGHIAMHVFVWGKTYPLNIVRAIYVRTLPWRFVAPGITRSNCTSVILKTMRKTTAIKTTTAMKTAAIIGVVVLQASARLAYTAPWRHGFRRVFFLLLFSSCIFFFCRDFGISWRRLVVARKSQNLYYSPPHTSYERP